MPSTPVTPPRPTLAERLATAERPLFSFEFRPPRSEEEFETLWTAIERLAPLDPDFVSVTYGANGSQRERTLRASERIMHRTQLETIGHLTCADQSVDELRATIRAYAEIGVTHILAIRGDMPGGPTVPWQRHPDGLDNATELVRLIKAEGDFCVGVAAFPTPHADKSDADLDARLLVAKWEAGAEFAITQLFFEPDQYFDLVDRVRSLGCPIPIIPGIMPVATVKQVTTFAELSGAPLPQLMVDRLQAVAHDPDQVRVVGARIASELAVTLLRGGAPGLQFFTQNRSRATREIFERLQHRHW
ncbi:methylenetetrahydrofolate reductase [Aestuariimicrobium sp. T2.26MG-19.2B]|uniref:methylenetetrahydrofolate reductase n=1 Tax=Aestuariimicrobium sp. T2.26MG-19.2B TaxID=3040679 RepID=UPI002477A15E|nr:methylenetetrahydrofolate reductase [Aestuariimicrobium sp. T2.26MG-19.2B]CAI9399569.1 5,10-methylenetetrahydrofolate reductase [Aestuariimicrobium sp. T2.26MG-19.2B]